MQRRMEEEQLCTPVTAPTTFNISIPCGHAAEIVCPVEGCGHRIHEGQSGKRFQLRTHFCRRHVEHTIVIEQEGLLPRCNKCGMFSNVSNTTSHLSSKAFKDRAERLQKYEQAKRQREAEETKFYVEGVELKKRA